MISAGDQFIWNFPNCGNPQKVQRYPLEWAESLRAMAAMDAELFVPAHGLPIAGAARIRTCLETVASTLETLVADVVDAMNAGAVLDDIVHSVSVPPATLELPYLRPLYDEPEFVIRNIWRLFGGWWDGNPARLKPPSDASIGAEVATLAGGVAALIERATELSAIRRSPHGLPVDRVRRRSRAGVARRPRGPLGDLRARAVPWSPRSCRRASSSRRRPTPTRSSPARRPPVNMVFAIGE